MEITTGKWIKEWVRNAIKRGDYWRGRRVTVVAELDEEFIKKNHLDVILRPRHIEALLNGKALIWSDAESYGSDVIVAVGNDIIEESNGD